MSPHRTVDARAADAEKHAHVPRRPTRICIISTCTSRLSATCTHHFVYNPRRLYSPGASRAPATSAHGAPSSPCPVATSWFTTTMCRHRAPAHVAVPVRKALYFPRDASFFYPTPVFKVRHSSRLKISSLKPYKRCLEAISYFFPALTRHKFRLQSR